jgi:hypothetical protein
MRIFKPRVTLRSLFAAAALFAMAAVHAQNANVVSANSSNDFVFSLNFFGAGGPTATQLNQDALSYASIRSMAFIVNGKSFALDLVVADAISGKIAVYFGDFTLGPPTAQVIWGPSQGPSPASPDGLTVDAAGNLFVVNSGKSPQLWVFAAAQTPVQAGCTPLTLYPALCQPVQIPDTYAKGQQLVETVIAPAGAGNTGHLLVLTNNPATVLDYPFTGGFTNSGRSTLITTAMFPAANTTTGGLAFWPVDNSLLITDQTTDSILRYSCCSSPMRMNDFAGSLGGNGKILFKIKTSYQATGMPGHRTAAPYAFVSEAGSVSDVLEFSGPGASPLIIDIHMGMNHPDGLAVTNAGAAGANTCTGATGCNPTGLLSHSTHSVSGGNANSPALVEEVCVVPVDNQRVAGLGCGTQLINARCPNFDTTGTMYIPGFMCSTLGSGFTVIKTRTDDGAVDQTLTDSVTQLDGGPACFPNAANRGISPASNATLAWGPGLGEGNFLTDSAHLWGPTGEIMEVTDGCGYVHGSTGTKSIWIEGLSLTLTLAQLEALVDDKYQDLETTIESPTYLANYITGGVGPLLSSGGGTSGCVPLSKTYFDFAQFEVVNSPQWIQDLTIAADLLSNGDPDTGPNPITCDSIVTKNIGQFNQPPGGTTPPFNPAGQVRSRLANQYFAINSRILGNSPNTGMPEPPAWPPLPPVAVTQPPSGFTECTNEPSGLYPPPGGCPTIVFSQPPGPPINSVPHNNTVRITWSLFGSTVLPSTSCTLDSGGGDSVFTPAVTVFPSATYNSFYSPPSNTAFQDVFFPTAGTVTYTLTCSGGPEPLSVQAVLNVT